MINQAFHFDTLVWDWPIALYLYVLGIASGMVLVALGAQRLLPADQQLPFNRNAAIGAPLMVIVGLTLLVFHLTRPQFFWYVMWYYNVHSVMSLGVMLFQLFFLALALWWLRLGYAWCELYARQRGRRTAAILNALGRLGRILERHARWHEYALGLLAVLLGVYTGFLLSTLRGFPLLNNGLLPVLFLNSGLLSGLAVHTLCQTRQTKSFPAAMTLLHRIELICVLVEALLLVAFFFGLYAGGGAKAQAALTALSGFWGAVFWLGVVCAGILLPLLLAASGRHASRRGVALQACVVLLSVLLFRFFILYAGQMVTA